MAMRLIFLHLFLSQWACRGSPRQLPSHYVAKLHSPNLPGWATTVYVSDVNVAIQTDMTTNEGSILKDYNILRYDLVPPLRCCPLASAVECDPNFVAGQGIHHERAAPVPCAADQWPALAAVRNCRQRHAHGRREGERQAGGCCSKDA